MGNYDSTIKRIKGGLVVSCQAQAANPFRGASFMAKFAKAAQLAGAVGIRANGFADIRAIKKATRLPIIGINKRRLENWPVYITPTPLSAKSVVHGGADIVAIDATHRPRNGGVSPEELIHFIQNELNVPVMADIDSLEEGIAAAEAGADLVATTLAGYTQTRPPTIGPDLDLVSDLVDQTPLPVVCEGRVRNPADLVAAFQAGAYAVVVGTAITNPQAIAESFVQAILEQ
jgi:putative N-acetylmannosamine-6-phosphate epimerase